MISILPALSKRQSEQGVCKWFADERPITLQRDQAVWIYAQAWDPKILEIHSNLIRAVTCARLAYFVDIGGMTATIRMIRVETIVRNGYDQHTVAVNVNAAWSRPGPWEVHRL